MSTQDKSVIVGPTVKCASSLSELVEEYKAYKLLRKKDEMQSNQEAGTPAYVVSVAWLQKYHEFILFDEFDSGVTTDKIESQITTDYFNEHHPGPM